MLCYQSNGSFKAFGMPSYIDPKFQNDAQSQSGEMEVKFRLARVQRYSRYHAEGEISNTQLPQETNTV
ncbi:hypothetical protein ACOSQ2_028067 [Xanthoceras sorbifolium]